MKRYTLLVALLVMLWATETMAYTIGFDGLNGSNLSSFSSYTESIYTVAPSIGQWFEAHIFGSPIPAIGSGPLYSADGGTSAITVTGGIFTFGGVDLTSNSAGGTMYTIAGSLLGVDQFTFGTTIHSINHFESISSISGLAVDHLTITGTRATGVTSFNIDNIRLIVASGPCVNPGCPDPNTVPEPASLMLLGAGLAGIEIWRRGRRRG